jgi:hypothetical protein
VNWKLIFQLSLFGLVMAVATVFVISSTVEPAFWLVIFLVCAVIIAKQAPGRPFLHGLCVSIVNSVWITGAHVLLYHQYIGRHTREAEMMALSPFASHPRLMMVCVGPIVGLVSGLVLGVFALVASKLVGRRS